MVIADSTIIDNLRNQIIIAAEQRFVSYGYGKTTMAEIAKDCNMSAANLYRYFKNKQDLAAEFVRRRMLEQQNIMRALVREEFPNSAEKLRNFVIQGLNYTHKIYHGQPKINELVDFIMSERQDMIHAKLQVQLGLITEILVQGNHLGEFDIDDVVTTARAVQTSLTKFNVPIFMSLLPIEEFMIMANELVDLLLKALLKRN